jgi:heme A synthase
MAWLWARRARPRAAWIATGALVAIVGEGLLGALVVFRELPALLVLVHLALAMVILALLLATAVAALPGAGGGGSGWRALSLTAIAATFMLVLSGASVVATGADEQCRSWPLCGAGSSVAGVASLNLVHRGTAAMAGLLVLLLSASLVARRPTPGVAGVAAATAAAVLLQAGIGYLASTAPGPLVDGLHVGLGTAVWCGVVLIGLLLVPRSDRESVRRPAVQLEKSTV